MSKIKSEKESRERLLAWARKYGAEAELMKIFARYDDLLRGAKTPEEREAIQMMGAVEVHSFFGGNSPDASLVVNGKQVK